jgi:myosin-1
MYRAKFAFEGQEGEMSLKKDDLVELLEKDDNGWWKVRKGSTEGWAPYNYLELVPPKPKAAAAPPPPARRPPPVTPAAAPAAAPKPVAAPKPAAAPKVVPKPVAADASARPVPIPGMANGSGFKKPGAPPAPNGGTKPPPPVSAKPKPAPPLAAKPGAPPPVAAKPGAPKPPGKPPVPSAARPTPAPPARAGGGSGVKPPSAPSGQMDLAAMVSRFARPCMCSWADWSISTAGKAGAEVTGRLRSGRYAISTCTRRRHICWR